jgi:tetratricopeptide (TPR) repeat protein
VSSPSAPDRTGAAARAELARGDALADEVEAHVAAARYRDAEPLAREVVRIHEGLLHDDDLLRIGSEDRLATILHELGDFHEARTRFEAALAACERAFGQADVRTAMILGNLARLRDDLGESAEARTLFERSLAVLERGLGPGDPQVAITLNSLGVLLRGLGEPGEAQLRYVRALAIFETAPGPANADVAMVLHNLAELRSDEGDFAAARTLLERAVAIHEAAGIAGDPRLAGCLGSLGIVCWNQGDFAGARPLLERAAAMYESALGPEHPDLATALNDLAILLHDQGDLERAEPLYRRALQVNEAAFGPCHVEVARSLDNLAVLLDERGDLGAAQPLFERALAIREPALGPAHTLVASTLGNLAVLHFERGDHARARPLAERALAIWEDAVGPGHPDVAMALNNLACIAEGEGDLPGARALYRRAGETWEAALGPGHPDTAISLRNLATTAWAQGDRPAARAFLLQAAGALDRHAATVLFTLAPAEQRAFVEMALTHLAGPLLSLADDAVSAERVYGAMAGWKGLLLEGLRRQATVARLAADPAHAVSAAALQAARTRVAHAFRSGVPPDELAMLEEARERLERELARALPAGAVDDPWPADGGAALHRLRDALPPGAAFADLYHHVRWESGMAVEWRYTGVVTGREGQSVVVDLGAAGEVDDAVDAWRKVRESPAAPTDALAERRWAPPDGALARVPWGVLAAALPPGEGRRAPLVAQTPSARALLRLLSAGAPGRGDDVVLVVGRVGFGHAPDGGRDTWRPLPATAREVRRVAAAARAAGLGVHQLTGRSPTPAVVARKARTAAYVHLATHGFFGGESRAEYSARQAAAVSTRGLRAGAEAGRTRGRSPLAASGLALAGANAGPQGNLTAEEIVGLSLEATRLVVLSACDTGRGAEVTGQGVLGLQAAVQAAGARALLMSLWPVPDAATAELMAAFYRHLWKHARSPAEALLHAQAALRDGGWWQAPVYWAGWSLVGDAFSVVPHSPPPS